MTRQYFQLKNAFVLSYCAIFYTIIMTYENDKMYQCEVMVDGNLRSWENQFPIGTILQNHRLQFLRWGTWKAPSEDDKYRLPLVHNISKVTGLIS